MTRAEAKDRVVEAARAALAKFCERGTPERRTDEMLPDPYWSPAGRMMNTDEMMALADALAQLDATPDNGDGRLPHLPAYYTYDPNHGGAYYFAPSDRHKPPYLKQLEVRAILDVAVDGTLAGVELVLVHGDLPAPPSPHPRPYHPDVIGSGGGS